MNAENKKRYLRVYLFNNVVSSLKIGILGSALVFIFVENVSPILMTANGSIAQIGGMVMSLLTRRYVGKLRRCPNLAYVTSHIVTILDTAAVASLYFYREFAPFVLVYLGLELILLTPRFAFRSSLINTMLGGNKHLSAFRVRYMSQQNILRNLMAMLGGAVNIAVFYFFDKSTAVDITVLAFAALILCDGIVDAIEHYTVKKTGIYKINE